VRLGEFTSPNTTNFDLSGLTSLTDAAAETLSKVSEGLSLNGLTSVSDAAAESLSKHQRYLSLNGLTSLSDAAAESLSKVSEDLSLDGLTTLTDAAAESLSKYNGYISGSTAAEYITWLRRQMHILVESEPEKILQSEAGSKHFEKIYEVDAKINGEVIRFRQHQTEKFGEFYYYDKESEKWKSICELKNGQHIEDCLDGNGGIDCLEKGDEWDHELEDS
jgi:hypothetical protein